MDNNNNSGLATAAMVLGIIAIVGSWIPFLNVVSLIIAIIALGLGIAPLIKKRSFGKALTGVILAVLTIVIFIAMYSGGSDTTTNDAMTEGATQESSQQVDTSVEKAEEQSVSTETIGQRNAVSKAKSYLRMSGFSRDGLVSQLEFEQFSSEDAAYGADNAGADWNEQAAKKAKSYMGMSSFSRGGLIDQLLFEKFTQEQAEHGATSVGL